MGSTIIVDFADFEAQILKFSPNVVDGSGVTQNSGGNGKSSKGYRRSAGEPFRLIEVFRASGALVQRARTQFTKLFRGGAQPAEQTIVQTFLQVTNTAMTRHHAAFTGNTRATGSSNSMVHAGVYPDEHASPKGQSGWNHLRLFILFKKDDTSLDPFDDTEADAPEASAPSRRAVREQLTEYAYLIRNQQHRTFIFALLVLGSEFRVMRYDQSGVFVTKKQDYVEDPRLLLSFFAWFDSLTAEEQGMDPTATLLRSDSRAYRLMDSLAQTQASDLDYHEGDKVPATDAADPGDASSSVAKSATPSTYNTRSKAKAAASLEDESYLDEVELDGEDPRVFRYVREKFRESLQDGWPRYKLEVGDTRRPFLVGRPVWVVSSLFGRGSRTYIALDVKTRRFVFLKDCWRPYYVGVREEGYYLEKLGEAAQEDPDIQVPVIVAHGDVENQVTLTMPYVRHRAEARKAARAAARVTAIVTDIQSGGCGVGPCRLDTAGEGPQLSPTEELNTNVAEPDGESHPMVDSIRIHTHYRVVVKDICLPFTEISSSKQLVSGIMDCIRTHSRAYDKLRLLHRDVSAGNIMIRPSLSAMVDGNGMKTVEWKCILTDWELAEEVPFPAPNDRDKSKAIARQPERTGTWQFMSVAYIRYHPFRPVSVADELESFFHVLLFYAIRLLHHNVPNARFFVATYFDSYSPRDDGTWNASNVKWIAMHGGMIEMSGTGSLLFYRDKSLSKSARHKPLNALISNLLRCFKARYAVLRWEDEKAADSVLAHSATNSDAEDALATDSADGDVSSEDINLAKTLDTHRRTLSIFAEALRHEDEWPTNDVVVDRMKEDYDPRVLLVALHKMFTANAPTAPVVAVGARDDDAPAWKKRRTEPSKPSRAGRASALVEHTGMPAAAGSSGLSTGEHSRTIGRGGKRRGKGRAGSRG
ncbi:hypothetical protein FKP32DRAFT_319262 [Trametes sanguinea]|nr:hypothetical protein FKP32DRAFT_319262 [Trametes sanguinea]